MSRAAMSEASVVHGVVVRWWKRWLKRKQKYFKIFANFHVWRYFGIEIGTSRTCRPAGWGPHVKIRGLFKKLKISVKSGNSRKIFGKTKIKYFLKISKNFVGLSRLKINLKFQILRKIYLGKTKIKKIISFFFIFPQLFSEILNFSNLSRRNKPFQTHCAYLFQFCQFSMRI